MIRRLNLALLIAATAFGADAAEKTGQFAIKGAGAQTCGQFIAAWDQGNTDLKQYAGWIDGYVTAVNQHVDNTYDTTPWQTTQTLLGLTHSVCKQLAPQARFIDATSVLMRQIWPTRLPEKSELEEIRRGQRAMVVYRAVLDAAKARLGDIGYDAGSPGAAFDARMSDALRAFQDERGLEPTGLPNQKTLFALFFEQAR
ncbi:MAG: peptidoglycan-binding domain-containing protein [Gammaproteobacteria bacterium]|nr:peptidoglycan-binding domain-containing protein [Gammaproteobacteria bacterium]